MRRRESERNCIKNIVGSQPAATPKTQKSFGSHPYFISPGFGMFNSAHAVPPNTAVRLAIASELR